MKIEKSFKILLIVLLILQNLASSCTRKKDYEFLVKNNTTYEIITLKVGCGTKHSVNISIEPNNEKKFTYHDPGAFFEFTEPMLCHTVTMYSDSINTYENKIGGVASIPALKEKDINLMVIEINPIPDRNNPKNIFKIKVN
jgi:hypothetical protein